MYYTVAEARIEQHPRDQCVVRVSPKETHIELWTRELTVVHVRVPPVNSFLTRTRDEKGRKLWRTEHNDVCENYLGTRNMLL